MPTLTRMSRDNITAELRIWSAKHRDAELRDDPIAVSIAWRRIEWLLDRMLELPQQR